MTNHKSPDGPLDDHELDALFEAAVESRDVPTDALMARIMADAADTVAQTQTSASIITTRPSLFARIAQELGGKRGLAGLAMAAVSGLAFGLGAPDTIGNVTGTYVVTASETAAATDEGVDALMSSYFSLAAEG